MESDKESSKVESGKHVIKAFGKNPPKFGNWKKVGPYWTLEIKNKDKDDKKSNPYGDVDPKKMEKDWDEATKDERPPIGGAKDD